MDDAQEFSKLFMSLLEDTLQQQQDLDIRHLVQRQFTGVYSYVTICSACGSGSEHSATFYELDLNIKGHRHLSECIDEFIKEEELEGDNQYMCAACNCKQNAVRRIQLQSLPPVLNVQLLRFVFDRTTGVKKKLNTYIQFPEVLDMSQYLGEKMGTTVYDLYAVLIHRGPSAYSGHYIAHIRDQKSDVWYKFNDEQIEKMGSKNLTLCKEDEQELFSKTDEKKPKTPKGAHCSRNAYMLVYCLRRKDDEVLPDVPQFDMLPQRLQKCLEIDNQRFEEWTKAMENIRDENVAKGHARQADVKDIYSVLPPSTEDDLEWIPTKWLRDWLGGDGRGAIPEVDTTPLLCPHGCMDPDKVTMAKCVSPKAGDIIYAKFKGKQRLIGRASLCRDCVTEKCRSVRRRTHINEDSKLIGQLLKGQTSPISDNCGYWVGKLSLRSWKKLALQKMDEKQRTLENSSPSFEVATTSYNTPIESCSSSAGDNINVRSALSELNDKGSTDSEDETELQFNEDLLCEEHGNLSIDENCRRLVPDDIWNRLKLYFPYAAEFPSESEPCYKCKAERDREQQIKASLKLIAAEQRSLLSNLYYGKNRPVWDADTNMLWLVTTGFLDDWRKFIRDPVHYKLPSVFNKSMLCQHGGLLFQPEFIMTDATGGYFRLEYLQSSEWQQLTSYVTFDVEVIVTRVVEDDGQVTFIVQPDVCKDCAEQRQLSEVKMKLTYTKAPIYVRKLSPDDVTACLDPMTEPINCVTDYESPSKTSPDSTQDVQQDQKCKAVKRKMSSKSETLDKVAKFESGKRRSSRHRKIRGEKELTVSSTMTLRDLKLEIMKLFSVAPFDQHLLLQGKELKGDMETLASFKIFPETTLYLKADDNVEDPTFLEEVKGTEEGFKGTSLMGR
ncbi:hypothetical protein LSH36_181g00016 [Paralvinella palmiformis]|uniref:ubiquitinyl hydrolase 1 n=1 Tax=Paralvinella palmiformis TaxID=53620 RepID=A0AAD9N728_9ANNE|nr:hypothetical protein LSH36_181g00016 [Paralvinella palmiformis]